MTSASRPLLIVTLPARSAVEARTQAAVAGRHGADAAEVRFDRWPRSEWDAMSGLHPSPIPLVATLRSQAEGGEGPDAPDERSAWRRQVAREPFAYIDREVRRDPVPPRDPDPPGATEIRSVHFPGGTPPAEVLGTLARLRGPGWIAKVVVPAPVGDAVGGLVSALPPAGDGRFVLHTTGPSGPLLRAAASRLGLAAVFAALPAGATPSSAAVEPAQLPVDRLRPFLDSDPPAPLFAVVGAPVSHSLSPALHHAWMSAEHRVGLYLPLPIADPRELGAVVPHLPRLGFRGINVTHPLKAAALALADVASDAATSCGCANVLTFEDGRREAENTDLAAVGRRLDELEAAGRWDGRDLLVVGSGGAARATLAAARARTVRAALLARSHAPALAAEFGMVDVSAAEARPVSLVVHATPVGRAEAGPVGVDLASWIGPSTHLLDFVYRPDSDEIARLVASRGGSYEDGRRLLAYSAAATYARWWGAAPPEPLLARAAEGIP